MLEPKLQFMSETETEKWLKKNPPSVLDAEYREIVRQKKSSHNFYVNFMSDRIRSLPLITSNTVPVTSRPKRPYCQKYYYQFRLNIVL